MALERAVKIAILTWSAAALAVELWLLRGAWPSLPISAAAAFAVVAAASLFDRRAIAVVLALIYVFPAAVYFVVGHWHPQYTAAWMALLLAAIAPRSIGTPWHVPARWRAPLVAWALVTVCGATIVALREVDFVPALFNVTTIANAAGGGWPSFIIRWVVHVALVTTIGILWFDWLLAAADRDFHPLIVTPMGLSALLLGLVAVYQMFVDVSFLNQTVYGYLRRASGTVFDANVSGTLAAVWIGGSLVAIPRIWRAAPYLAAFGAAIGWLAVWASGSRTAFGAAVITSAFCAWGLAGARRHSLSKTRAIALVGGVGAVGVAIVLILATADLTVVGPLARFRSSLPAGEGASIAAAVHEQLWNRNGYGAASTAMIKRFPWFGVGVGSFQTLLPEFAILTGGPLPPDNAQNWYRHQVAELGAVGSVPWIVWLASFGWCVLDVRSHRTPPTWALRGMLIGLAVISFVGMPGQEPMVAMTFWMIAAWYSRTTSAGAVLPLRRSAWAAIAALAVVYGAGTLYGAFGDLRVPARAQRGEWGYSYGFYSPAPPNETSPRWTGRRAVAVFEALPRWMRISVSIDYRTLGGSAAAAVGHMPTRPTDVKVWMNGDLLIDRQLTNTAPVSKYFQVREGHDRWVFIETWVSRVIRPVEFGIDDDRELGMAIDWSYVDQPPPQ